MFNFGAHGFNVKSVRSWLLGSLSKKKKRKTILKAESNTGHLGHNKSHGHYITRELLVGRRIL